MTGDPRADKLLAQLREKLEKTFSERLISVLLYGSAASGNFQPGVSDLNILCVLSAVTPRELGESESIFNWWRKLNNPAPVVLSEIEVRTSTDCFAIEFHDMKEFRKVLAGRDVLADLEIDNSFYRARVEYELRAKLLRLRQKAAGVLHDRRLLGRLLADSYSTFNVLLRHALLLCGHPSRHKPREVVDEAERKFGVNSAPLLAVISLRERQTRPDRLDVIALLDSYIQQIEKVIGEVDKLEK